MSEMSLIFWDVSQYLRCLSLSGMCLIVWDVSHCLGCLLLSGMSPIVWETHIVWDVSYCVRDTDCTHIVWDVSYCVRATYCTHIIWDVSQTLLKHDSLAHSMRVITLRHTLFYLCMHFCFYWFSNIWLLIFAYNLHKL